MKKKFVMAGAPVLNNIKLEEFFHEHQEFEITSNSFHEMYFNGIFVGHWLRREKTNTGWKISIQYCFISGYIAIDEIEVIEMT